MTNPNNIELNKGDQFIIGLDISGSMGTTDCPGGASRIAYSIENLKVFVTEAAKWDPDGVSFYPFGASVHAFRDQKPEDIDTNIAAFSKKLEGMTRTDLAITKAFEEHVEKGNEQTFLLIITDGDPSDRQAVEDAIIKITNTVADEKEFRIGFVTVGVRSSSLDHWLTELDDNLTQKGAKYDIVDVKRLEDVDFYAAVEGALND